MDILGVVAVLNVVDAPRWNRDPWMGWILGLVAFLVAGYFFICAVLGWRAAYPRSHAAMSE